MGEYFSNKYELEYGAYGLRLPFTNLYVNFDILEDIISLNVNSGFVSQVKGEFETYEMLTINLSYDNNPQLSFSTKSPQYLKNKYDLQETEFARMIKKVYKGKKMAEGSSPFIYFEKLPLESHKIIDSFIKTHLRYLEKNN
jgi:hypothetical protein